MALQEAQGRALERIRGSLWTVPIESVRSGLEELDWVAHAQVWRVWPGGVRVRIEKNVPAAVLESGKFVSREGRIYSSPEESLEVLSALPVFEGDARFAAQAVAMLPALQASAARHKAQLRSLAVSLRGSWKATVASEAFPPFVAELGRQAAGGDPVRAFDRVMRQYWQIADAMQGYPEKLDARYRNAVAAQVPSARSHELWVLSKARGGRAPIAALQELLASKEPGQEAGEPQAGDEPAAKPEGKEGRSPAGKAAGKGAAKGAGKAGRAPGANS
ncbi:MAG: FtsQ-type POTRA domain-containing protein [Duodenibacillus sp.]|nr:FtsQ-type POTRA domain-containing protein [Duodenibacillus sp.]